LELNCNKKLIFKKRDVICLTFDGEGTRVNISPLINQDGIPRLERAELIVRRLIQSNAVLKSMRQELARFGRPVQSDPVQEKQRANHQAETMSFKRGAAWTSCNTLFPSMGVKTQNKLPLNANGYNFTEKRISCKAKKLKTDDFVRFEKSMMTAFSLKNRLLFRKKSVDYSFVHGLLTCKYLSVIKLSMDVYNNNLGLKDMPLLVRLI
jgi:hypothetical protein